MFLFVLTHCGPAFFFQKQKTKQLSLQIECSLILICWHLFILPYIAAGKRGKDGFSYREVESHHRQPGAKTGTHTHTLFKYLNSSITFTFQ